MKLTTDSAHLKPLLIQPQKNKPLKIWAYRLPPQINRSLKDLSRFYWCVITPIRTYSPQDKALVENAVQLTYQRIYYPMRNMTFFSVVDMNREVLRWLAVCNDLLFQQKVSSGKELCQSIERGYLKPLPAVSYEMKDYRRAIPHHRSLVQQIKAGKSRWDLHQRAQEASEGRPSDTWRLWPTGFW